LRHSSLKMAKSIAHFQINEVIESALVPSLFRLHIYCNIFCVNRELYLIIFARAIKTVLPVKCLTAQRKKWATESSEFVNIDTVEVCTAYIIYLHICLFFVYLPTVTVAWTV